jgi:hypothetical protein
MRNTIKNCEIIRQISDKKYLIVIVGERGKQFVIDLRDSLQRRYELVRELKLSDSPKEEICAKYWYSKKNEAESLKTILLEKSDSISQRNERSKCNRTPEEIKRELDKALKTGFHTFYGGSFSLSLIFSIWGSWSTSMPLEWRNMVASLSRKRF